MRYDIEKKKKESGRKEKSESVDILDYEFDSDFE